MAPFSLPKTTNYTLKMNVSIQKILIIISVVSLIGFVVSVKYACHCKAVSDAARAEADKYRGQLKASRDTYETVITTMETIESKDNEFRDEVQKAVESSPEWSTCPLPDDVQRMCYDIIGQPDA